MNNNGAKRRLVLSIAWIVIGVVVFVLGVMRILDEFWNAFGLALVAVGTLQLIRQIRYRTSEEYKEKFDIRNDDERNKFLSTKAWAWTGYTFIICCAVGTIGFKIAGLDDYSYMSSMAICLMCVIYVITNVILRNKY